MFEKKTVRDVEVGGKVVLVRADYNVPLTEAGEILSDFRIRESLATLRCLLEAGAKKIFVISHMGRPEGEDKKLSLRVVAERLSQLLGEKIGFETGGERIVLLENLRFDGREEENSVEMAQEIVEKTGAELFVQDGFGVVHRAHTSTSAIPRILPSVAGLLLEKEVVNLEKVREPESPSLFIAGGAKVADKAPMIERFAKKYTEVAVGGKIANEYEPKNENVVMPVDFVFGEDGAAYDIGEGSAEKIVEMMEGKKAILWNGTLGKAEEERFAGASRRVAEAMGRMSGVETVVVGGDTTGFVEELCAKDGDLRFSLISTGGGAALEFLLGVKLPGIEVLENK